MPALTVIAPVQRTEKFVLWPPSAEGPAAGPVRGRVDVRVVLGRGRIAGQVVDGVVGGLQPLQRRARCRRGADVGFVVPVGRDWGAERAGAVRVGAG